MGNFPSIPIQIIVSGDNHDYGKYDVGTEFELKEITKKTVPDIFSVSQRIRFDAKRQEKYDATIFGPKGKRVQVNLG